MLFSQKSMTIVLLGEVEPMLVCQSLDLVNKVVLLLLEGVVLAVLMVFEVSGEALLLLGHFLGVLVSDCSELSDKVVLLLVELSIVVALHLRDFVPIALLLSLEFVSVPLVQLLILFCLLIKIRCISFVSFLLML